MQVQYKGIPEGEIFICNGTVYVKSRYGNGRYGSGTGFQPTDKVIPAQISLEVSNSELRPGELFTVGAQVHIVCLGGRCMNLGPEDWGYTYTPYPERKVFKLYL